MELGEEFISFWVGHPESARRLRTLQDDSGTPRGAWWSRASGWAAALRLLCTRSLELRDDLCCCLAQIGVLWQAAGGVRSAGAISC